MSGKTYLGIVLASNEFVSSGIRIVPVSTAHDTHGISAQFAPSISESGLSPKAKLSIWSTDGVISLVFYLYYSFYVFSAYL